MQKQKQGSRFKNMTPSLRRHICDLIEMSVAQVVTDQETRDQTLVVQEAGREHRFLMLPDRLERLADN